MLNVASVLFPLLRIIDISSSFGEYLSKIEFVSPTTMNSWSASGSTLASGDKRRFSWEKWWRWSDTFCMPHLFSFRIAWDIANLQTAKFSLNSVLRLMFQPRSVWVRSMIFLQNFRFSNFLIYFFHWHSNTTLPLTHCHVVMQKF